MATEFSQKKCVACEGSTAPLNKEEAGVLLGRLSGWSLSEDATRISKRFTFNNFADAFAFAGKIAALAESEGHHPDMSVGWGYVAVVLSTHAIKGLSENDFILAAKIERV